MRKLGWLTVVAMSGAFSLVACSDDDTGGDTGGTAGTRDSGTDARGGGGSAGTSTGGAAGTRDSGTDAGGGGGGSAGVATGGSAGIGTGGSAGMAGAVVEAGADVGTDGITVTRDAAPDVAVVSPEPQPEAGARDSGIDSPSPTPEAAVDAGVDAPDPVGAATPEAEPAEAAGPEAAADAGDMADAGVDAVAEAASDAASNGPTLRYGFETGIEGWTTTDPTSISLAASTAQADTGTGSLAITMSNANYASIRALNPPAGLAAGTFSVRIFVPAATTLTVIKPYNNAAGPLPGRPFGSWEGVDGVAIQPSGSWQTYTFNLPTTYQDDGGTYPRPEPFWEVGLQLQGNGVIYLDSVTW